MHVSAQPLAGDVLQFKTIAEAVAQVKPGDHVIIHGGVYREPVKISQSGTRESPIVVTAAAGEFVLVTGSDPLATWRKEADPAPGEKLFSAPWDRIFNGDLPDRAYPANDYHRLIGRSEQVIYQGRLQHQVLRQEELSRGSFWVDEPHRRLYFWPDNNEDLSKANNSGVEASTRPTLWTITGDDVQIRGIVFRYAANRAQQGAVQLRGRGDVAEDCVFERMNAVGVALYGESCIVRRCLIQENGQLGFSANRAHQSLVTSCTVRRNNTKGFAGGWEAGGNKIVLSRQFRIQNSQLIDNAGPGIWFDIGNEECEVANCLITGNSCGIFYEISYGLHAHDNVIMANGLEHTPGGWGNGGICISSSPQCLIERNLLLGNCEAFTFREQERTTPRIADTAAKPVEQWVWNHESVVQHNVLAWSERSELHGWFDIADNRHWTRRLWPAARPENGKPAEDIAAGYQATGGDGRPEGLSLEALKLQVNHNLYWNPGGAKLLVWGASWKMHKDYPGLEQVRADLGFETEGRIAEVSFVDYAARDLRVPSSSPLIHQHCYPQGSVPGVVLGTLPSK